ncbi:hypothetical protein Ddc_22181 [Ditylenchus destructor]|nr:hypothetical protein Ddc_22181 [Ditylenchus destructor]
MSSKLIIVLTVLVLVVQVAARPPNPADECVLGDDSTCPEDQYCKSLLGCSPPPGTCNPATVCRKRENGPRHG